MPWVKNPEFPVELWSQLLSSPGGPSAQVSRCQAAAAGFPPPSFPPGSACFHAEGRLCKPLRPWGRQPGSGKLHSGIQVPRAASCPRGLILVLLLLLLEGVKRGRKAATALIARSGGQALGEGLSCACMIHSQSLPFARFCAERPRASRCSCPVDPPPLHPCTGAQGPPASWSPAWAEPPGPYFCCWRQLLAHLWGVSTGQDRGRGLLGGPSLAPSGHMQPPRGSRPWAPPHCPPHQQPCFSSSQCTERGN